MKINMLRGAWSDSAGKKITIIASILLLAAACSKKPATSSMSQGTQPAQVQQTQNQPANSQATGTFSVVFTPTPPKPVAHPSPVTLNIYNNAEAKYKILYASNFSLLDSAALKANNSKIINTSACQPYGLSPEVCFVLKNQPYQNTNLTSAVVAVTILKDKKTLGACGNFTEAELSGGSVLGGVQVGDLVFLTAKTTDAGAGNYSETHFNRAFYGTICYELVETVRWTNAQNYSPPRAEFDKADIWNKLDILRNDFSFIK